MTFTPPKLVIGKALDDDSVEFLVDDKKTEIYFNWSANDGEKWTFDLLLNHPDLAYSMNATYYNKSCINELIKDLSYNENVTEIPQNTLEELSKQINAIIEPHHDNRPIGSAHDCYYGI